MLELMSTTQRHLNDTAVRPSAMPADAQALQRLQHYHRHHELLEAQLERAGARGVAAVGAHRDAFAAARQLASAAAARRPRRLAAGRRRTTRRCTRGGTTGAGATLIATGTAASTSSGCCGRRASSFFVRWRGGSSTSPRAGTLMSTTEHPRRRARLEADRRPTARRRLSRRRIVNVRHHTHAHTHNTNTYWRRLLTRGGSRACSRRSCCGRGAAARTPPAG